MKLAEAIAAISGSSVPGGYTLSHRQDADTLEHVLRVDGPVGWYAEVTHLRQIAWLRKCVVSNVAGSQNTDSAA